MVKEIITSDKKLVRLAKNIDRETADQIKAEKLAGIEINEDAKRYYPLGAFASHILGSTTDDNVGLTGLERYYNRYLAGLDGRWITSKDSNRKSLVYGTNKYYSAEDGYTLVTTIDENIQYIVTQKIQKALLDTRADRVMCMIMDPNTAEILAMAQTGEYDPNDPRAPRSGDEEKFAAMSSAEQVAYWNKLWRNFCVCDTYEPGSTFKLITTSIALDTGVTYLGETFYCSGTIKVADRTLRCWYYPRSHGRETLQQAVENSCNPVMIQLAQRLGLTAYYEGLDAFGLTEKTGIDFPGESSNILQNRRTAGPVGLATMSYGQGIAVTPVSLVTAIGSLANGGYLMQPRLVKALLDPDGNVVESYDPVIKSRSVSKQTAEDVLSIMEMVVSEGGGGNAKVPGYRIGGKTGTANKPEGGGYSDTDVYASFIGVAPIDDPKFVILVIVDTPRGVLYGSSTAAPCAKEIMQEVLLYMDVQPQYTDAEKKAIASNQAVVPDLTGQS
ncbi:MAG: stage V sporulation protein D, partial [Firmicutes bacterium]|nr:stage V sporulation protein D [Bacillota bacterium]